MSYSSTSYTSVTPQRNSGLWSGCRGFIKSPIMSVIARLAPVPKITWTALFDQGKKCANDYLKAIFLRK